MMLMIRMEMGMITMRLMKKSDEYDDKKKMNKMLLMIWKTMWMVFG